MWCKCLCGGEWLVRFIVDDRSYRCDPARLREMAESIMCEERVEEVIELIEMGSTKQYSKIEPIL